MSASVARQPVGGLLSGFDACVDPVVADIVPRHLTLDSRRVEPGDGFLAMPGRSGDGRTFIESAFDRGASVVLVEADGFSSNDPRVVPITGLADKVPDIARVFYGDPSARMAVVAVTGTNGKTSVVDFIGQILRSLGVAAGCIGTLGARTDDRVLESANTTPDVVSLNRQLAEWLESGVDHVAMEASSHALDQGRLRGLSLQSAVFTNLSRDHLDYHQSEHQYAEAKLKLFREFDLKRAIFNADDSVARNVRAVVSCPAIGISLEDAEADVYVQVLQTRPLGLRVHAPLGTHNFAAALSGTFNAFNLTAAVLAVAGLGYSFADVIAAAERVSPVVGRMQLVPNTAGLQVVVDYAHTPDALARALTALRPETSGELWVVFGCGGDRDRGKRSLMAAEAAKRADRLVVTSDNPRTEQPEAIIDEVLAGLERTGDSKPGVVEPIVDRKAAIGFALSHARPGDTVLIAGKGHENYQEVNGIRQPFCDREVARIYLAALEQDGSVIGGES